MKPFTSLMMTMKGFSVSGMKSVLAYLNIFGFEDIFHSGHVTAELKHHNKQIVFGFAPIRNKDKIIHLFLNEHIIQLNSVS